MQVKYLFLSLCPSYISNTVSSYLRDFVLNKQYTSQFSEWTICKGPLAFLWRAWKTISPKQRKIYFVAIILLTLSWRKSLLSLSNQRENNNYFPVALLSSYDMQDQIYDVWPNVKYALKLQTWKYFTNNSLK